MKDRLYARSMRYWQSTAVYLKLPLTAEGTRILQHVRSVVAFAH